MLTMRSLFSVLVATCISYVHGQSGTGGGGIIGFGVTLYEDLCCQACHDSLSSLFLSCTTFSNTSSTSSSSSLSGMTDMPAGMGNMPMGMTSPECYASNTPWLETMAYCIQEHCNVDGYPPNKQAECFQTQAVNGASAPTFQQSLSGLAPTVELAANATWLNETSLVNRVLYDSTHGSEGEFARITLYLVVIGACVFCGMLSQTAAAVPSLQKHLQSSPIRHHFLFFWPKLRQHLLLPACIGNTRRLEPLPGQTGYVPRRALGLALTVYVLLNVVFSAVGFRTFQPNNTNFKSAGFELCEYVGNRAGVLSLVNASIAILFAGRNQPLIALTGWSLTTFLTLHRWIARIATVQAVVHSVVYTAAYWQPGYDGASAYLAKVVEPFYWWGIIATICFCFATGASVLPVRTNFYETFHILHIVLVGLALTGCWYHLVPHFGYTYGYQTWLYICFAYWGFDRAARITRVGYYNRLCGSEAVLEAVPDSNVMQLTVVPHVAWAFGPGQHSVLYFRGFAGCGWFGESHPFSVAGWKGEKDSAAVDTAAIQSALAAEDAAKEASRGGGGTVRVVVGVGASKQAVVVEESESPCPPQPQEQTHQAHPQEQANRPQQASVTFLIRAHGGITAKLLRRLALSTTSTTTNSSIDLSVYTEGPYGGHRARHHSLLLADTVICIAGGIGITGVLGYMQVYASAQMQLPSSPRGGGECSKEQQQRARRGNAILRNTTRLILAWSAREMSLIEHVRQRFLPDKAMGVECSFWCTGESIPMAAVKQGRTPPPPTTTTTSSSSRDETDTTTVTSGVIFGRMDTEAVIRHYLEEGRRTTVLVCGPGRMADEAAKHVVSCVRDGYTVELIEEPFAW